LRQRDPCASVRTLTLPTGQRYTYQYKNNIVDARCTLKTIVYARAARWRLRA